MRCALGGLILAAGLAACGSEEPTLQPLAPPQAAGRLAEPPSIVWITLDTLRRDHLSCYGHVRTTSPRIDALAQQSLVFERAVVTMASTLPSHLSMLTGLYPHQHGIEANTKAATKRFAPAADVQPVSLLLRDAGWETAGFVSAQVLGPATGVGTGFTTFDAPAKLERPGTLTTTRALTWLRAQRAGSTPAASAGAQGAGRFLLWIHLFDVHEPNLPPAPFDSLHERSPATERLFEERSIRPETLASLPQHALVRMLSRTPTDSAPIVADRDAILDLFDRYDGDVSYVDACVGRVLDALDELGLASNTVVAIASDHGQSLGQNDWLGHGRITDENVLAALIVRFPPGVVQQPQRIPNLVSLVDLFPTLLARFDAGKAVRAYLETCEGRDVLSGRFAREFALCQQTSRVLAGDDGDASRHALLLQDWRYERTEHGVESLRECADPRAGAAATSARAEVTARCARELDLLLARKRATAHVQQKADTGRALEEDLRALGYAGDE